MPTMPARTLYAVSNAFTAHESPSRSPSFCEDYYGYTGFDECALLHGSDNCVGCAAIGLESERNTGSRDGGR